jgi:hypothetical protein
MTQKRLLRPERLRRVPPHFSWLDHRLVRDNRLAHCDTPALALYLILVTVADAQGLSYYSTASLARLTHLAPEQVGIAREQLIQAELIAFDKPLYQVLALDCEPTTQRANQTRSAGELLRHILAGGTQ